VLATPELQYVDGVCLTINISWEYYSVDYFHHGDGRLRRGEIAKCDLTHPQVASIEIGPQRLERFGPGKHGQAKYELIQALPRDGVGVSTG
jgi:hypothetical protein